MLEKINEPKKLRYQKNIDFFTQYPAEAVEILRENEYEKRVDKYARYETQRKKKVGKIELNISEQSGENQIYELPVYVAVDIISPKFYSKILP